jgi:thiamine phosphate synthase YjbQ (UPF0047 family)
MIEGVDSGKCSATSEDKADAHFMRQIMEREVVVAVTNGRQDGFALLTRTFGTWERILRVSTAGGGSGCW